MVYVLLRTGNFQMPLQRVLGRGVGLLPRDAPVFELVKANRLARNSAAHIVALHHDLIVAIEVAKLSLAAGGKMRLETIHALLDRLFGEEFPLTRASLAYRKAFSSAGA